MSLHVLTGTAAPASAPANIAEHYVDIVNRKIYQAVGVAASSDWLELNQAINANVRTRNGFLELKNETDNLFYQLRCRNNIDGKAEIFISDTGAA